MQEEKKKKKKRPPPIVPRQRKYFQLLCKGYPPWKAAVLAGYSGKNPAQSAYQASKLLRERIAHAMAEAGLTPEGLIHGHLLPALKAEKTEFAKLDGKITDRVNVVAWETRLKAIELAAQIGGYLAPRERIEADQTQVNVLVNSGTMARNVTPTPETLV